MSAATSRGLQPATHPLVLERRVREGWITLAAGGIAAVTALAVTIALPSANLIEILLLIAALVVIYALMVSTRLPMQIALIVLYLGLLDGPVKLLLPAREATASVQDALVLSVTAGCLLRMLVRREKVSVPPLFGWVALWTLLVVANAFNPDTQGVLHVLGGFRNQLQYVPFFFFGYVLMRSKRRFRQMFIIMGVLALANGVVAAYQTELTPQQIATWGPGYHNLIDPPAGAGSGRTYFSEGEARVRPPGLGSNEGASGAIGHVALPMCLALFAVTRRRRWIPALLAVGAVLAVIVGLGRLQLIGAGLGVITFAALTLLNGREARRAVGAMLAITLLAIPAGAVLVTVLRSGTFSRYEKINASPETTLHKEHAWSKIPKYVEASPFGFGLGNSGSVSSLGGHNNELYEGHGLTSETQYNVLVKELGAPGLVLWPLIALYVIYLILTRIRRVRDPDMAIYLAGALAAFVPLPIEGTSGFLTAGAASGAYFWFAIGIVSYWLVRKRPVSISPGERGVRLAAAPA